MAKKAKKAGGVVTGESPWQHCQWEPADAQAIQALFRGDATDIQQRRAINFIANDICSLPFLAFDPASQRNTDFALGKQAVGHRIVFFMRLKTGQIPE